MQDVTLTFGKVVATPTATAWSQAYNAGSLFAVLSLTSKEESLLNALGKDVIKALEEEYFTLEEKNLESIKEAVSFAVKKIPEDIAVSFVAATLVQDIMYLYLYGSGEIVIRRGGALGTLLSGQHSTTNTVLTASGQIENNDAIVLQTKAFSENIDKEALTEALSSVLPSDAAESLAPNIHKIEAGDSSAIILYLKKPIGATEERETGIAPEEQEITQQEPVIVSTHHETALEPTHAVPTLSRSKKSNFIALNPLKLLINMTKVNHTRKIILSIIIVVFAVFATSLYFAGKNKENQKLSAAFTQVYQPALEKYQQAQVLENLNAPLSHDDYIAAQKILSDNKNTFPDGSSQRKQIDDLLAKINTKIGSSGSSTQTTGTNSVKVDTDNGILVAEQKNPNAMYATQTGNNVYFADNSGISQVDSNQKAKQIIKKSGLFQTPGGIASYNGNIYILDKSSNKIIKFVSPNWSNADYLVASETPDFSKAQSITIDTAVYILYNTGTVEKYLRGSKQNFALSNINKPLSNPTRIFTSSDATSLYVLDKDNSRIVIFSKVGLFKTDIVSPLLKSAKDFWVSETDKKIFFLSSDTIYEINLK